MKLFKFDSPIFNGLSRISDVLFLSVLWTLGSVPIFTIGASTTALYYCVLKINQGKDAGIAVMFFKSFRQNFKQGCILTIIFVISGLILYIDLQACVLIKGVLGNIIKVVIIIMLIVWGILLSYAFPMLAQFENTTSNILKNSLVLSVMNFWKTILVSLVNAIPVVLFWGLPYVFILLVPIFLMFGVAIMAFINSKILIRVFEKYIS